jgi:hypothetical protein
VKATRSVSCRMAKRVVDKAIGPHGCQVGTTCHVYGYRCTYRRTGKYTYRVVCTDGTREIVGTGGV